MLEHKYKPPKPLLLCGIEKNVTLFQTRTIPSAAKYIRKPR